MTQSKEFNEKTTGAGSTYPPQKSGEGSSPSAPTTQPPPEVNLPTRETEITQPRATPGPNSPPTTPSKPGKETSESLPPERPTTWPTPGTGNTGGGTSSGGVTQPTPGITSPGAWTPAPPELR